MSEKKARDTQMNDKFRKLMWGVLLSGCQLPFMGFSRMLPAVVGYAIIVWALAELVESGGTWYETAKKRSLIVAVFCLVTEGFCIFLDGQIITECVMILFYLEEILLFSDFMRGGRKHLMDHHEDKVADEFKKKRLLYLKIFLLVVVVKIAQAAALGIASFNPDLYSECLSIYNLLNYAVITTVLVIKIWLSTVMSKLAKMAENQQI